eukprot:4082474-Heterocapsa_arctica.AAC.2
MDITEEGLDSRKRQRPDPESIQDDDSVPMDISEGEDQEEAKPDHEDDRPGVIQMEGEGSANPASEADNDTVYIYTIVEGVDVHISVDRDGDEPTEGEEGMASDTTDPQGRTEEGQPGSSMDAMETQEEGRYEPILGDRAWEGRNGRGSAMEQDFRDQPRKSIQELWSKMLVEAHEVSIMCNVEGELRAQKALQRIQIICESAAGTTPPFHPGPPAHSLFEEDHDQLEGVIPLSDE